MLGESNSALKLAMFYLEGEGVAQDYTLAVKFFKQAANAKNGQAMYQLGLLYDNGIGVEQDSKEAFKWYELSAQTNNS